ncbi:SCO7613 C-terminal domain-containing membrane protein [Streptomyces sp. NPDC059881]|uniref:SCO7613 C-terminal domain-containing membrane protein n=1 Tax=Streptomyces sp. NPDC059881 TaxID=3346986 RepID=UPI00364B0A09
MENAPPPAEELRLIDRELAQLDARRALLLARRGWLLQTIRPVAAAPADPARTARPGAETSPPSAQNVLLTLGGILLAVAAIAFTLVSWGHLGIGGRALVLGAVTVTALATPALLLRRGLVSTAESVAALGLLLTVLDAYALHRVAFPGTHPGTYAAVASGVLAALWAGYGPALGNLRLPVPAAVVAAQFPLPLWALAAGSSLWVTAWATLATAALDVAIALATKRPDVRVLAILGAVTTGGWSLLTGGWLSVSAHSPSLAVEPALLLLAAAGLALCAAWRAPASAVATAAVAGLASVAGVGGVLRAALPGEWAVPAYLLCAIVLLAAVRTRAPHGVRTGLAYASGAVHAASAIWAAPAVILTLLRPAAVLEDVWSGVPAQDAALWGTVAAPVVAATVAVVLRAAPRLLPALDLPRTTADCAALALAWSAAVAVPTALSLPYAPTLVLQLLTATAALALAVRPPRGTEATGAAGTAGAAATPGAAEDAGALAAPGTPATPPGAFAGIALACGLASATSAAVLGLATRPATFAVLGVLVAVNVAAALLGRGLPRAVVACGAVVGTAGLVAAAAAAAGLPAHQVALALLAVPAAAALLGVRLGRHPVALPVEATAAVAGLLAIVLAVPHPPTLALVLALAGVIAAGTSVRAERRPAAGYLAAVLFVAATWVRLAASGVEWPEAYTLPVTVPALAVGVLRRRRDPQASSWSAYGPGLTATLVPSLFAAWGDTHWLRPLLLGLAALAVTLAGARLRLQAPLVLGGLTLALDTLHELAPYVVQVVDALPRWLPPALAGLLLLAVGATYEQRLRDARRLRDGLGRMR